MTEPLVADAAGRRGTTTQRRALVVGVVVALVAVAGLFWVAMRSGEETTTAYCTASASEVRCLLQVGGRVQIDDTTWIQDGTEHTLTRPACLDGHDPEVQVTVGYQNVEIEHDLWAPQIRWVDCDSALPTS